jgi:ferredoxin-NADP reductase
MTLFNIQVIVTDVCHETESVKVFTLKQANGRLLPPFVPGAHVAVKLGHGHQPYIRHYSICSDPANLSTYQVAVHRSPASRGGSAFWHDEVQPGDLMDISEPRNQFTLSDRGRRHILIAGGIGVTPFLPMMRALKVRNQPYELHYAAKSPAACAFYQTIMDEYPETRFYFSEGPEVSRVTPDILAFRRIGTHVYICGPRAMITDFTGAAVEMGYSRYNIHFERFTATDTEASRKSFDVWLQTSQRHCRVQAGETLLMALNRLHIEVPYSCQIGGCGACEVPVVSGCIEHRDFYLSDAEKAEGTRMLSCVSRAKAGSQLILDL